MTDDHVHLKLARSFPQMTCTGIDHILRSWRRLLDLTHVPGEVKDELAEAASLGYMELDRRRAEGCGFHDQCKAGR